MKKKLPEIIKKLPNLTRFNDNKTHIISTGTSNHEILIPPLPGMIYYLKPGESIDLHHNGEIRTLYMGK